jgi:hypothetical protein
MVIFSSIWKKWCAFVILNSFESDIEGIAIGADANALTYRDHTDYFLAVLSANLFFELILSAFLRTNLRLVQNPMR